MIAQSNVTRQLTTPPVYQPDRLVVPLRPLLLPDEPLSVPVRLIDIINLAVGPIASYSIDALIALRFALATSIDGQLAELQSAIADIDALIADKGVASFTLAAAVAEQRSGNYSIDALLVPQPGVAILGPGLGTWTCPPAVTEVNVYLWGQGGEGSTFIVNDGGPGGGGGGYVQAVNAPVTPGTPYSWVVEPELTALFSSMNWDGGGFAHAFRGGPGNMAGPGAGGIGIGGTLQYAGGNGGQGGNAIGSTWAGGGGQAAGPWGDGIDGGDATPTASGSGGGVWTEMGSGGPGGSPTGTTQGLPGMFPGGGGGGQAQDGFAAANTANGADGLLILTWNAGVHFLDASISKAESTTSSLDALLANRISLTHSIDALLSQRVSVTHTIDGVIAAKISGIFAVDALLALKATSNFSVNSLLAGRISGTYTIDASLLAELLADDGVSPLWADDGATWLTPG